MKGSYYEPIIIFLICRAENRQPLHTNNADMCGIGDKKSIDNSLFLSIF